MMNSPTQTLLNALPPPGVSKTPDELATQTGIDQKQVVKSFAILKRHGLTEAPKPGHYRLTAAGVAAREAGKHITSGPNGPHSGRRRPLAKRNDLRSRLWKALRHNVKASIPFLLTLAGATGKAPENNAQRYMKYLVAAGYVRVLARREKGTSPNSPGFNIYLLINDTGPDAPYWSSKDKALFDPNLNKLIGREGGENEPVS